jgi:hypothetical protein
MKLSTDKAYMDLAGEGLKYIESGVDDVLCQTLYLTEGEFASWNGSARYMPSPRSGRRRPPSLTASPSPEIRSDHRTSDGIRRQRQWQLRRSKLASAARGLATFEEANNKASSDEGWLKYLDSRSCYVQDVSASQATLYARIP